MRTSPALGEETGTERTNKRTDDSRLSAQQKIWTPPVLAVVGRPGAGKDTHGEILAAHYGYDTVVTSKELKRFVTENPDSPHTRAILEAMAAGELAPDEVVAGVMGPIVVARQKVGKLIPNGFPRNLKQYDVFREIMDKEEVFDDYCLHFDIWMRCGGSRLQTSYMARHTFTSVSLRNYGSYIL
jgi:adenylate kinase family enzyme